MEYLGEGGWNTRERWLENLGEEILATNLGRDQLEGFFISPSHAYLRETMDNTKTTFSKVNVTITVRDYHLSKSDTSVKTDLCAFAAQNTGCSHANSRGRSRHQAHLIHKRHFVIWFDWSRYAYGA